MGGSAAPRAMIAGFKERHNLMVCHGWGTETSPVASMAAPPGRSHADEDTKFDYLAMQGILFRSSSFALGRPGTDSA